MDTYQVINNATEEWSTLYAIAQNDRSHHLYKNYEKINLSEYEHMIVNIRDNIPAAFHGIFNNGRWPKNFSRICNRAYINPHFRNLGHGLQITSNNIKFVLDNYTKWGKEVLFITRGVQYNDAYVSWKKFEKFVNFLRKTTGYTDLTYDDRLYKCCNSECKDCYQFAVWYNPYGVSNSIPNISINQWGELNDK
jgi:hypothetical protein